jgi:pentatricopeptide repeat protein
MDEKTATIIQLCQEMRQLGLTAKPAFYNSLLKFCVMKKDVDLAWNFYHELASACKPTRYTFSILLDLTRQQKDTSATLLVLDAMDQHGVLPDRAMASTVMLTLCDQHQYTEAAEFVAQLAHQCPQLVGPIYQSVLMDTIHRHYCEHGPHRLPAARRRRRLDNRKIKRKQARMEDLLQQQQQQQQQQ